MDLKQCEKLFISFGFQNVQRIHCNDDQDTKEQDSKQNINIFRDKCRKLSIDHVIVCNYSLQRLENGNGNGYGHFSPIIGYHEKSDRLLLLYCWTQKYWLKLADLYLQ